MKHYCLGFLFSEGGEVVALIKKDHPEQQIGKLNGIGGEIGSQEISYDAMEREFLEEAGVKVTPKQWDQFGLIDGGNYKIYLYRAFDNRVTEVETQEEEEVILVKVAELDQHELVADVKALINMALDPEHEFSTLIPQVDETQDAPKEEVKEEVKA